MTVRTLRGVPVDTESGSLLINEDGSLSVRSRIQQLFPLAPIPKTVGLTPVLLAAANDDRQVVKIFNLGTNIIYYGIDNTVTVANGMPVLPYCSEAISGYTGDLYAVAAVPGVDVRTLEVNKSE